METEKILKVPFAKLSLTETLNIITDVIEKKGEGELFHIITANPEMVIRAKRDIALQNVIEKANLITPDGYGIIFASKLYGGQLQERVTGIEVFEELLKRGNERKWTLYLLGATKCINQKAREKIQNKYPTIQIVGTHDGYFSAEEENTILDEIEKECPDILAVALGSPKAEKWIYTHKERLKTKVAIGIGGSLDVLSGEVKRAPKFWQKCHIEWLYRLFQDPRRWRRQLALLEFTYKILKKERRF